MSTVNVLPAEFDENACAGLIRSRRTALGLTQSDLAARLRVSKNAVASWESGRTRPDLAKVPQLCRLLQVTLPSFFGMPEPNDGLPAAYHSLSPRDREVVNRLIRSLLELREEPAPRLDDLRRVYYSSEKASAGTGNMLGSASGEYVYLHLPPALRRADELIPVCGDSMEPTYHHGDLLLVEHTAALRYGEIGVFTAGEQGYVKEYQADGLHSHNPKYAPLRFSSDEEVRCVGRVLGIAGPECFATAEETALAEEKKRAGRPAKRRGAHE